MKIFTRMLDESKSIVSSSGNICKSTPIGSYLKRLLIHTSNSERIFLKQSKGLLFVKIN